MTDDQKPKTVLTKEMIEKLKAQLDAMEGKEINEGDGVVLKNPKEGVHVAGWYIAYSTIA